MAQGAVDALLDDVALVDAHHHFWELSRFPYRWLAPDAPPARFGDKSSIRWDYLPETYLRDMGSLPLSASVHVQANCGADDPVEETRWLQGLSDRTGWPTAAIAEVDLSEPGAIRNIDRHRVFPILRGIRAPVAWDAEGRWRVGPRAGLLSDVEFRDAARHLADHDLCLDMVVVPEQTPEVADFAGALPGLRVVVNHFGTLEPSRPGNVEQWEDGLRAMADRQNVFLKLSGLWTVDKDWNPDVLAPHVGFALDTLGAERMMYGSNLPVEGVNCPLARQFRQLSIMLAERPRAEIVRLFSQTAREVYRL
jgi:predicted TIM-barrel fold metal-dependent hydrolase